jgi:hypothetical protein
MARHARERGQSRCKATLAAYIVCLLRYEHIFYQKWHFRSLVKIGGGVGGGGSGGDDDFDDGSAGYGGGKGA